jgi:4-diphosphocytidyl-2-C-methyl-D-erythritol kinase
MKLRAYAKINPVLDVTGRRSDGYHEVRMILQTIDLYDEIEIRKSDEPGVHLTIKDERSKNDAQTFSVTGEPGVSETTFTGKTANQKVKNSEPDFPEELPTDGRNLAVRAAQLMIKQFDIPSGFKIRLIKKIPAAAGLAGGSADAAAVLCGIRELTRLPVTDRELEKIAVKLGADVPYCIYGGCVLAEGIGEMLTELSQFPDCSVLVVKPACAVSTKEVYTRLDAKKRLAHPDVDGMIQAIAAGSLTRTAGLLGNVLEAVTAELVPEIESIRQDLNAAGAIGSLMSGSGPTVFGIFPDDEAASLAGRSVLAAGHLPELLRVVHPVGKEIVRRHHTAERG